LACALFFIWKVFVVPDCLAFDSTDDANHTFVNLFSFQETLKAGALPLINLANNFGTPLIGDAVTYPYALGALTYWIFPFEEAMTINRFVVVALTVFFLSFYFRKYMSSLTAGICALLAVSAPGFVWHVSHHNYQSALLFFVLMLFTGERFEKEGTFKNFLYLSAASILMMINTSFHIVILIASFAVVNQLILNRFKLNQKFLLFICAIFAGVIFSLPDTLYLITSIKNSVRVGQWYIPPHLRITTHLPIALLGVSFYGLAKFYGSGNTRPLALRVIIMGILPVVLVLGLMNNTGIWEKIPLLKSVDISRLFWFSNVFVLLAVGKVLDDIVGSEKFSKGCTIGVAALFLCEIFLLLVVKKFGFYKVLSQIIFVILCSVFALQCRWKYFKGGQWPVPKNARTLIYGSVSMLLLFLNFWIAAEILGINDISTCRSNFKYHFSPKGSSRFEPSQLLRGIKPGSRMAVDAPSFKAMDLKASMDGFYSSTGRSVFLNKDFTHYLFANGLIKIDQVPASYHFKGPWNSSLLSDLGIKYVINSFHDHKMMKSQGWQFLADDRKGLGLYENTQPTSLVYLRENNGQKINLAGNNFKISGNSIHVTLPQRGGGDVELIASFVNLPGWKVFVDGKKGILNSRADHLLGVNISGQNRDVHFRFAPFTIIHYLLCMALASGLITLVYIMKYRKV